MAVQEQTPRIEYAANGATTSFPLTFDCEDQDYLIVTIDDNESSVGSWQLIDNSVVFRTAPATGSTVTMQRNSPFERTTTYQTYNNSFRPEPVNKDLDRIWWKLQELGLADWLLSKRLDKEIQDRILADLALKADYISRDKALEKDYIQRDVALKKYIDSMIALVTGDPSFSGIYASMVIDSSGLTQEEINDKRIKVVDTVAELSKLKAKFVDVAYVRELERKFIYSASQNRPSNGVTVVGGWEMELQDYYYASWFAKPDVREDQSEGLGVGSKYAASRNRPYVIDAHICVDPPPKDGVKAGLWIPSYSKTIFLPRGAIEMLPNNSQGYDVLRVQDITGFAIISPRILGDARTHLGTQGEWGYGLTIYQSENGLITDLYSRDMWGDGLYIGTRWGDSGKQPKNIKVIRPVIDGARRNGISVTSGEDILIDFPLVKNTKGVAPEAGIDIELEESGSELSTLKNVVINNATLIDNVSPFNIHTSKVGRFADVHFKGMTTIKDTIAEHRAVRVYRPDVPVGGTQDCLITFDKLRWESAANSIFFDLDAPVTGSKIVINELELSENVKTLNINYTGAVKTGQPYGGFNIKRIANPGLRWAHSKFYASNNSALETAIVIGSGVELTQVFNDPAHSVKYTSNAFVHSSATHAGWSTTTNSLPNIIWQDPSVDTSGNTEIYMQTSPDFRKLRIGLHFATKTVGRGCNINGLKIPLDGVIKTRANSKQPGAWIEFQNDMSGNTRVFDSFGVWIFS